MVRGARQTGKVLETFGWWPGTVVYKGSWFRTGDPHYRDDDYGLQTIKVTADCKADCHGYMTMRVRTLKKLTINQALLVPVAVTI